MSSKLYFRCRRFIDLDNNGNEIQDNYNYGYSLFDDNEEILHIGMSKKEIIKFLSPTVDDIVNIITNLDEDICCSFLNSMENGLCINGFWIFDN